MQKISAIILAKNEEKHIAETIACVSFCDEIIVIDDNSTDATAITAKKLGAKVIPHALANNFSQQRNFAISKAECDWILFIDADERISTSLAREIKESIHGTSQTSGFYIKRLDYLWGKLMKHGETGDIYFLRLAKKNTGKWIGKVHETWVSSEPTQELKNPILHYPHVNVTEFLKEINFYSTLRAEELFENKIRVSWTHIILFPTAKFAVNYIFKAGFLDGTQGLIFAILMSFHSFLVRGKLWQLWNYEKKLH